MHKKIDQIVFYQLQKQSCDIIFPLRKYGYLCNDTVTTSSNKLRDFQCKFADVRMTMKDMSRTE